MTKKNYVICFKNLATKIIQIKIYLEDEPVQIKVHIKVLKKFKIIFDLSLIRSLRIYKIPSFFEQK